jgi:hypothetical protein
MEEYRSHCRWEDNIKMDLKQICVDEMKWMVAESTKFLVLISISLRSILIFSSHLCLGLPKCVFPANVLVKHFESTPVIRE